VLPVLSQRRLGVRGRTRGYQKTWGRGYSHSVRGHDGQAPGAFGMGQGNAKQTRTADGKKKFFCNVGPIEIKKVVRGRKQKGGQRLRRRVTAGGGIPDLYMGSVNSVVEKLAGGMPGHRGHYIWVVRGYILSIVKTYCTHTWGARRE